MKGLTLLLIIAGAYSLKAHGQQADTSFCTYFRDFIVFNETQNNATILDLEEMGMDTLPRDGEDDMDFVLRHTRASISRMIYEDFDIYKVQYHLYSNENAHIFHNKSKNLAYYKEDIPMSGLAPDYTGARKQLLQLFTNCGDYEKAGFVREEFNKNDYLLDDIKDLYKDLYMDVFKVKNSSSDFRYVIHTNTSAATGHLEIYIIHKNFLQYIVTK
ncbi:MAG: hypothetical protein K0R65_2694 [Crocinitomicaceae bacterium]|jgi:hypothetical protein|nr:hypothetical protein [Crocinitomicaceae bacterium]